MSELDKKKLKYIKTKAKLIEMPKEVKVPSNSSDLVVITKAKDLVSYIFQITKNSPKKFRMTFVNKLQNLGLEIVENMYKANEIIVTKQNINYYEKRFDFQKSAMTNLKLLEYFALLSLENDCILLKHYEQIAKQGTKVQILLANWIKSDRARLQIQQ